MSQGDLLVGLLPLCLAGVLWIYAKHIVRQARRETERLRQEYHSTPAE